MARNLYQIQLGQEIEQATFDTWDPTFDGEDITIALYATDAGGGRHIPRLFLKYDTTAVTANKDFMTLRPDFLEFRQKSDDANHRAMYYSNGFYGGGLSFYAHDTSTTGTSTAYFSLSPGGATWDPIAFFTCAMRLSENTGVDGNLSNNTGLLWIDADNGQIKLRTKSSTGFLQTYTFQGTT